MSPARSALTIIAPIERGREQSLRACLRDLDGEGAGSPQFDFRRLQTTHFLRWVVLDQDPRYPPKLAFESNHDGTVDGHLDDLLAVGRSALLRIYGHCEAGPGNGDDLKQYLLRHALPYAAFYQAYPNRTLAELRNNTRLRDAVQEFLDLQGSVLRRKSPSEILAALLTHLRAQPGLDLSIIYPPMPGWQERLATALMESLPVQVLAGLTLGPLLLPLLIPYALALRLHELRDQAEPKTRDSVDAALVAQEDFKVQNQLTHVAEIKPGVFRHLTLRVVLAGIEWLARHYYNRGNLGGIPSIHFARWVFIDEGRRLLFFSNYDGSWENYLGDFIDRAASGLTGVWSNTLGFPPALLLFLRGATNEDVFKQWTRDRQIPTQLWYSAHADESVQNILDGVALRDVLARGAPAEALGRLV